MEMMIPSFHAVSAALAAAMVMGIAEGVALTAVVGVALRLLPGLGAGVRSAVWMAALGMSVLLPAGSLLLRSNAGSGSGRELARVGESWALAGLAVWALLSAVRLGMLVAGAVHLRQVWRRAMPIAGGAGCGELLQASRRKAELCVSSDVDRPSVVGFLRPKVLLPAALFPELSAEELEHIVRHEMQHLARRDDWINLAQKLSLALFPLNPVLFWLDWRLCAERELACDDGVLRRTRAPKAYAGCLARLAESRLVAKGRMRGVSALALGAWAREPELSRRVHRILGWRESAMEQRWRTMTASVLMTAMVVAGVELARCPELLRFTNKPELAAEVSSDDGAMTRLAPSGGVIAVPVSAPGSSSARPKLVLATARVSGPGSVSGPMRDVRRSGHRLRSRTARVALRRSGMRNDLVTRMPRDRADVTGAPRVVLTTWPAGEVPVRLVLTVADEDRLPGLGAQDGRRFAAFAMRDGWLFVSL